MAKVKTWEQYYRRSSNKLQVIDEFIACKLEEVVTSIEQDGLSGRLTLLMLKKIDKEFNFVGGAAEIEQGYKIKEGWFRSVLLQTCLSGKDTVHFGFTQKVNELYFHLGWSYMDSVSPICSELEDIRQLTWANPNGIAFIDVVVYPTSEFPIGSVWMSSAENRWEILEVDGNCITMINVESWGNKRRMVFSDRVIRSMKRVV